MDQNPTRNFIKETRWALLTLVLIIVLGTYGYWKISNSESSVLDALYMTVITVASIGFGEITIHSGSPEGRLFTILISLSGIGILSYVLTAFTAFFVEGHLHHNFRKRRMDKKIAQLQNHHIVCGFDGVGRHILQELQATKRPYVLVTRKRDLLVSQFSDDEMPLHVIGDPGHHQILERAGIHKAVGLFASDYEDNHNLMVVLTARQINPAIRIVAHCRDLQNEPKMRWVGANAVISMEHIGGMRMASEMVRPTVVSFLDTMLRDTQKNLRIEEIKPPANFMGRPLGELRLESFPDILLLAVRTPEGWRYHPPFDFTLPHGSTLIVMTTPAERQNFELAFSQNNA